MIGYLEGEILSFSDRGLVLLCGAVGYEINMGKDPRAYWQEGDVIHIHTFLHVREDAMELYGFTTHLEKELFLKLKTVTGIGAKSAAVMVASTEPEDLIRAISLGDEAKIREMPGCGPKTAKRILLELKDAFDINEWPLNNMSSFETLNKTLDSSDAFLDVREALAVLGYQSKEIEDAIRLLVDIEDKDTQSLLKSALKVLQKK